MLSIPSLELPWLVLVCFLLILYIPFILTTPDVTGLIAYYLGLDPSLKTNTSAMKAKIISTARQIALDKSPSTGDPGILINNGILKQ